MAASNAPVFPYPGGTAGNEPPDPVAGKPGHFAWSRWIKQFVKNLNAKTMSLEDRVDSLEPLTGHANDTTAIHGIADTAALVLTGDARLSNARTPTAHAASHAAAGSDPVTVVESQVTGLTAALAAKANLASPAFTGNPTAPTPAAGDANTRIATTLWAAERVAGTTGATGTRITRPNTDDRLVEVWNPNKAGGAGWSVVEYDSGWRSLPLLNGATGELSIRRCGSSVTVRAVTVAVPSGGDVVLTAPLPDGFHTGSVTVGLFFPKSHWTTAVNPTTFIIDPSTKAIICPVGGVSTEGLVVECAFIPLDMIPTSLPGTLVSAAPA